MLTPRQIDIVITMANPSTLMSHTGDISENTGSDIPLLARQLFHEYGTGALQLADESLGKVIDFLPELFPGVPKSELDSIRQVLVLERIVKFCHTAENLGAFAVAFKSSFDDEKQEILGIFQGLTSYKVGHVVDFYKHIQGRHLQYVAKIVGYPLLVMQRPRTKKMLELSCQNIRDHMAEIGGLYNELRPLYDAYKHGYRVSFGHDNTTLDDVIVYVDIEKHQKVLAVPDKLKKTIAEKAAACFHVLNVILKAHRARVEFEATGQREGPTEITLYRKKTDPRPASEDLHLMYPTRGERLKKDVEEADAIYNQFKQELESQHMGEFVAIDIDEKKIIAMDLSFEKVRTFVQNRTSTGRVRLRKVGEKARTGLDIY